MKSFILLSPPGGRPSFLSCSLRALRRQFGHSRTSSTVCVLLSSTASQIPARSLFVFLQSPLSLHTGRIANAVPHFATRILAEIPAKIFMVANSCENSSLFGSSTASVHSSRASSTVSRSYPCIWSQLTSKSLFFLVFAHIASSVEWRACTKWHKNSEKAFL